MGVESGLLVSYYLTLVYNEDGTAKLTGSFSGGGQSKTLNANLKWEYVSGNQYVGKSGDNSLAIYLTGDTLTITVNPKKMGIADFDIDYDVHMTRSSGAVSTATPTTTATVAPTTTTPDAVVGLWNGTIDGNVPNEIMIDFLKDGTGSISVIYYLGDTAKQEKKDINWEYVSVNKYQANYGSTIAPLGLYDDMLTISLIPSAFIPGTSDSPVTVVTKSFILPPPYIESPV